MINNNGIYGTYGYSKLMGGLKPSEFIAMEAISSKARKMVLNNEIMHIVPEWFSKMLKHKKYGITNKELLDSGDFIAKLYSWYPPNIVEIRGKRVWYYHGLEEGLMRWDSIDKRKLKKEMLRNVKPGYFMSMDLSAPGSSDDYCLNTIDLGGFDGKLAVDLPAIKNEVISDSIAMANAK